MPHSIDDLVLHIGFDDSNHAGERKGEILVATFSFNTEDHVKRKHGTRANYAKAKEWLSGQGRDYRFAILLDEKFRHSNTNLSQYAPNLVDAFLESNPHFTNEVTLNFDGKLSLKERAFLVRAFNKMDFLEVNCFPKTVRKQYNCPLVVYIADSIAHHLYRRPLSNLLEDPRYVPLIT